MKKQIVATGFVLFSFMLPLKATAATFNQLFVFGDSLSDPGNVFNVTKAANQLGLPVDITPQSPPYFNGRFSDGPVWVEELGSKLGLTPTLYANLIPGGPRPTEGINFAFGGATTGRQNVGDPILPGLQTEIDLFKGGLGGQPANKDALYILWAGANDYLGGKVTNPAGPLGNLSKAVTDLYQTGARNFLVANLPDLGKTPLALSQGIGVSQGLNQLTGVHNQGLSGALDELSKTLNGINLIPFDVNSLFNNVISKPGDYGFTNVTDACLVSLNQSNPFVEPFLPQCPDPENYLFWDFLHPTTKTHQILADAAFNAIEDNQKSVPEPSAELGILALGALGAGSMLKRKVKKVSLVKVKVDALR
jgi:phospholipase/lecithinase/hemolysin